MAYDISIMNTGPDGKVDYRFSGLSHRIVGKEKMTQHYIKYLYDDNVGGLIKLFRTRSDYGERDIIRAAYNTFHFQKNLQSGRSLHPDEVISQISIQRVNIDRKAGRVDIDIKLTSASGATTNIVL